MLLSIPEGGSRSVRRLSITFLVAAQAGHSTVQCQGVSVVIVQLHIGQWEAVKQHRDELDSYLKVVSFGL